MKLTGLTPLSSDLGEYETRKNPKRLQLIQTISKTTKIILLSDNRINELLSLGLGGQSISKRISTVLVMTLLISSLETFYPLQPRGEPIDLNNDVQMIASTFASAIPTIQPAYAIGGTVSDGPSCIAIGGTWDGISKCTVSSLAVNSGETLTIASGITLQYSGIIRNNSGGTINNSGTIINRCGGIITNSGTLTGNPIVNVPCTNTQAAQATQNIISQIGSLNLPAGTTTSLDAKLQAAISSFNAGDCLTAKSQLTAFINEVSAQSGKKISVADANTLISEAQNLLNSLPC